jgi:hypothetical protein
MGWLDKLLGRDESKPLHGDEATPAEHERHVEQSANPGTAPVVSPDESVDPGDEADEVHDPRGETVEDSPGPPGRNAPEAPTTPEPPRSY